MVAGDAVGGVGGPGVRDQQAGDPALRAPHAAALAQVQHLEGRDLAWQRDSQVQGGPAARGLGLT